jgi:hypothetical protein
MRKCYNVYNVLVVETSKAFQLAREDEICYELCDCFNNVRRLFGCMILLVTLKWVFFCI